MKSHRFKTLAHAALAVACLSPSGAGALSPMIEDVSYGFIDRKGDVVVPPACDRVSSAKFGDWVSLERDGKQGFLNLRTRQSTGLIFERGKVGFFRGSLFSLGPEPVRKGEKYGYVDQTGQTIVPFRYELADQFAEDGLAVVKIDGKFGYIDRRGDFVIPPRFDRASEFNAAGLASVNLGGSWGAIDRRGRLVIPAKFDKLWLPMHSDLVIVGTGGRMGAVDARGRIVVPIKFGDLRGFGQNGLAAASLDADPSAPRKGGHWGFIDRSSEFVAPPVYIRVSDFEDEQHRKDLSYFSFRAPLGLAEAVSGDAPGVESTTYIDARGKAVISLPTGITGVGASRNGLIRVFDARKRADASVSHRFGIFDPAKPAIPTAWFDVVGDFGDGDLAPVLLNSWWGYADRTGTVVIAPQFRSASAFTADGFASVQAREPASGRYGAGLIDRAAKVLLQTPFDEVSSFGVSGFAQVVVKRGPANLSNKLAASQCAARTP